MGVGRVRGDVLGSDQAALMPNIPDGGEWGPDDFLRCLHHSLQEIPVWGLAGPKPDRVAAGQQTLHGAPVEGDQEGDIPHPAQEVQALLCLFCQGGGVKDPG